MRVLIIVPWGEAHGGAETMLTSVLRSAAAAECAFDVVLLQAGPLEREAQRLGATTFVVPSGRLRHAGRFIRTVRRLADLLSTRQPDVILAWAPKVHLYAAPAARLSRCRAPVVWWQHGIANWGFLNQIATLLPAQAVGCSSHVSAAGQREIRPRRPTFVVHPGLPDPGETGPATSPVDEAAESVLVGVVGRLQPGKRQDRFLRALANLRAKGLPIEGLLVGGDAYGLSTAYAAAVGRLIDELRLRPHVTVTGQVADAIPYIRGLDILVNASEDEAFGIVLVEAMACGVPVVAVGKGGPTEIVEPTTGVLVATGEPAELAAGIERLVVDAQLRAALGAGSRAAFERRFSIAAMGQQFGAEIRKLVDG